MSSAVDPMGSSVRLLILWCLATTGAACAGRLALDGTSSQEPPVVPPPPSSDHLTIGLVSAAGAPGMVRADWRAPASVALAVEAALFVSPDAARVFSTSPHPIAIGAGHALLSDLPAASELFVGLGIRQLHSEDPYVASGPLLSVCTTTPLFVDVHADPTLSDGLTPETAFDDLLLGILVAQSQGTRNVWVLEGEFPHAALPVYTGIHVLGGFTTVALPNGKDPLRPTHKRAELTSEDLARLLAQRDPRSHPTRLVGAAGQVIATIETGTFGPAVLDGLSLDGAQLSVAGIDDTARAIELRSVAIERCQRGVKLRSSIGAGDKRILLTGVSVTQCSLEGVSVDGPFDITVEACRFAGNLNEGMDLNHLVALDGATSRLVARASFFERNGTEGMDVHLGAPLEGGLHGGAFQVAIQDCEFVDNALDGLRIDIDYETAPLWRAEIVVRGVRARSNRGAGIHLDLDARSTALVQRIASTANAGDGLLVTSESFAGMATVSASSLAGNLGAGIRASGGRFGVVASHCVIAGNRAGGCVSDLVPSVATSSVAYLQTDPWIGAVDHECAVQEHALPPPFQRFSREFARAVGVGGGALVLDALPLTGSGALVEVADDGVARVATSIAGASLVLDPPTAELALPASVAFFDARTGANEVVEDLRLTPNSVAVGAGMSPPGIAAPDAGPFASPFGGVPGRESELPAALFYLGSVEPPWTIPLAAQAELHLEFVGGTPDLASALSALFVVRPQGVNVPITLFVEQDVLIVAPPPDGWHGDEVLEICAGLQSTGGRALACPVGIPLRVR